MATMNQALVELHAAIAKLHRAAAHDHDSRRDHVASWLDDLFVDIKTREQLSEASGEALGLYRGGMGSFHDVGTAVMAEAVDGLNRALHAAHGKLLRG
ncbi:DUF6966 domain-containing protein [Glutamicibacter sp.]|uniref:DUF6966 domain-containing protein n=1 Tax=Glutamicibacter sp. TaxID=1931995 RepID=UPI002B45CF32|nr:hypothetical protein [Glutamicibacter sp.]HJX77906.1 hypothetical protein [Glutamicibacter sp.]